MRTLALSAILVVAFGGHALAWGKEGHSIIAEIAQRRLSPEAARSVGQLLGRGHSLVSIASWADDARDTRPETSNWHFADMPLAVRKYRLAQKRRNNTARHRRRLGGGNARTGSGRLEQTPRR